MVIHVLFRTNPYCKLFTLLTLGTRLVLSFTQVMSSLAQTKSLSQCGHNSFLIFYSFLSVQSTCHCSIYKCYYGVHTLSSSSNSMTFSMTLILAVTFQIFPCFRAFLDLTLVQLDINSGVHQSNIKCFPFLLLNFSPLFHIALVLTSTTTYNLDQISMNFQDQQLNFIDFANSQAWKMKFSNLVTFQHPS